jgi:hypothetical protein
MRRNKLGLFPTIAAAFGERAVGRIEKRIYGDSTA